MDVILGPMAAESSNYGSGTGPNSIKKLMKPLKDRDQGKWIAGHLLNDNLGGSGSDPKNLTPLTATANKQHSGFELKVKNACIKARQFHEANKNSDVWKCIHYRVNVSGTFENYAPYSGAPRYLVATFEEIEVDKKTGTIRRGTGQKKTKRVENKREHL
ncbi:MAG: hypothetical protein K0V04_23615 [Deltaproteobacteria bacterium]|nr:hypothetical protein [Deltaproteobacteria bacterium]